MKKKEIKDLIESNLRQRVLGNTNPVKLGRCFEFLNNWYGFKHGAPFFQGNQYIEVKSKLFTSPNTDEPSTQKELAESYGITKQTMNNYMRMANMIPELEDLVDTNIVMAKCAVYYLPNISCTCVYFDCKSIYECGCGIVRVRGFRGWIWGLECVVCICLLKNIFDVYTAHSRQIQ